MNQKEDRIKEYSLPNIEKNGELALFYNLAYNRLSRFIATKNKYSADWELRDLYFSKNSNQTRADFDAEKITEQLFSESTYADLKLYVFKEAQGPKIRWVSPVDIKVMNLMILQLLRLRDYFSHYFHDDFALWICHDLKTFIDHKFKVAKEGYQPKYAALPNEYATIFEKDSQKLNNNGFNFFLGFFLTRGQMEVFLANRQYFKEKGVKVNDKSGEIKDYDFARYLITYYNLSDSHQLNVLGLEKNNIPFFDRNKYLSIQINNYLHTVPEQIYEMASWDLKKERKDVHDFVPLVQRRSSNFLPLVVRFMAGKPTPNISWQVSQKIEIEKKIERDEAIAEDESAVVPNKYFDYVYEYKTAINPEQNPILHDNNIRIALKLNEEQTVKLLLSKEAFMTWCSARLHKKEDEWLEALRQFLKGYADWIDYLHDVNQEFKPQNYPIFNEFLIYKGVLSKPLLDLYHQKKRTEKEAQQQLNQDIDAKFVRILGQLNTHFSEYLKLPTQLKIIDKAMITKQNSFKFKETSKAARLEVINFNIDVKERKNIRYEKQRLIHACLRLLFGKRARFPKREQKNNFDRFCYLLDLPRNPEKRNILIIDWLNKLNIKNENQEQNKVNRIPTFNERFENILMQDATCFDDLFEKILNLAKEKIEFEKTNLTTNQEWKNLFGLAKKYNVPYLTIQKSYETETDLTNLLAPHRTEKDGIKYYHLGLPARHFLKNGLTATTQKAIYEPIKTHKAYKLAKNRWRAYVSDHAIFAEFDTIKNDTNRTTKQAANALHHTLMEDVLLTLMYGELNRDEWKFSNNKRIKESSLDAVFPLVLDKFKIFVSMKEMHKNDSFIEGNRILKTAEILYKQTGKLNFNLKDIKKELGNQQTASRNFISELLKAEQILAKNQAQNMNLKNTTFDENKQYKAELKRIKFEDISQLADFVKYRNTALHTDILTEKTYPELIIELKKSIEAAQKTNI